MSIKGVLNVSAIMLSCIAGLLSFVTFVLSSFYSTAQAQWATSIQFREETERRHQETEQKFQAIQMELKNQQNTTGREIREINKKLDTILVIKLRQPPG